MSIVGAIIVPHPPVILPTVARAGKAGGSHPPRLPGRRRSGSGLGAGGAGDRLSPHPPVRRLLPHLPRPAGAGGHGRLRRAPDPPDGGLRRPAAPGNLPPGRGSESARRPPGGPGGKAGPRLLPAPVFPPGGGGGLPGGAHGPVRAVPPGPLQAGPMRGPGGPGPEPAGGLCGQRRPEPQAQGGRPLRLRPQGPPVRPAGHPGHGPGGFSVAAHHGPPPVPPFFFFSSRRRHTRCSTVSGVQTCAPIWRRSAACAPSRSWPGPWTARGWRPSCSAIRTISAWATPWPCSPPRAPTRRAGSPSAIRRRRRPGWPPGGRGRTPGWGWPGWPWKPG